ncbi:YncE family protein [Winogradskyella bathintestinalis]|jgi:hypothetical protein|uniref:YncE family protein n=1 Tax=Winogradskyella bathintestinalis TaxID=3035208 RepID=A0ABT7ZUZ9_9FLAO|nr:hypothetical protein [Winogradskyella bathintestinalis]MDN3492802.1 hypothetical protein [Winogradskyella bathintestinalis]
MSIRAPYTWLDKQASLKRFYAQLQKDNEVIQVTVTNHTRDIREVCLWGAQSDKEITADKSFKNTFDKTLETEQNPIDVIFNEASDKYCIINEGADAMTVLTAEGVIDNVIDLNTNSNVDIKGPIKIAYNSNPSHPNYGDIAIACRRADQILILDHSGQVKEIVNTGVEPVDVIFNTYNNRFYVANSKSTYLTMIDQSYQSYQLDGFAIPLNLGFNNSNGDVLVNDFGLKEIHLISESGELKNKINGIETERLSIDFDMDNNSFYAASFTSDEIYVINANSLDIDFKYLGISKPSQLIFESDSKLIRVLSQSDSTLKTLSLNFTIIGSEEIVDFDNFSFDGPSIIYLSSAKSQIQIKGTFQSPTVTVNEEYYEDRQDFQYNPAMVRHVKLVASGEDRINALQIIEKSVTGTEFCKTISLSNSQSPQNFANVSEVFDFDGNLIDGHVTWCFKINPLQQVTFLIYYNQIEMYNLLPEKSRISTGVQMSKGIPVSWLDNPKDEPPNEPTY